MTKELTAKDDLNCDFRSLFPPVEDESTLLLGCSRSQYTASAIARAVEDCNAQVLNLNVTSIAGGGFDLVVAVRVNHRNATAITRSLERYGFDVISVVDAEGGAADAMRDRVNELLRYLEI